MAVLNVLREVLERPAPVPPGTPMLEVRDLCLAFEQLRVLDRVSFDVQQGELFAVIGPNGAGKTSLFNCLTGLYKPHSGSIRLARSELVGQRPHRIAESGLARTFQNIELFPNLTVLDNVMLGRHRHLRYGIVPSIWYLGRARRDEIRHREVAEYILEFLEIAPYRKHAVSRLPYGLQKRVELARALATAPSLLLLDEPVAGMNLEEVEDMARFILDIKDELGITVVLVEHDMGLVMDIADRVLVQDFGRVVAVGPTAQVQEDPAVIDAYLGSWSAGEDDELQVPSLASRRMR